MIVELHGIVAEISLAAVVVAAYAADTSAALIACRRAAATHHFSSHAGTADVFLTANSVVAYHLRQLCCSIIYVMSCLSISLYVCLCLWLLGLYLEQ